MTDINASKGEEIAQEIGAAFFLQDVAEEDLAALCVDACNEYGWTIAFPQVALSNRK